MPAMHLGLAVAFVALSACATTATPTGGEPSLDALGRAVVGAVGAQDFGALIALGASSEAAETVCRPGFGQSFWDATLEAAFRTCSTGWSRATNVSVKPRTLPVRVPGCESAAAYERIVIRGEIDGAPAYVTIDGLRLGPRFYFATSLSCAALHPRIAVYEDYAEAVCECADATCVAERNASFERALATPPASPPTDDDITLISDATDRGTQCLEKWRQP